MEEDLEEIAEKNPHKLKKLVDDEAIKKLVDEYYSLDFEDIIGGTLKTRFKVLFIYAKTKIRKKYTNVAPEDYGLDDELLLYTDDKILNNYVSLKHIAPYSDKNVFSRLSLFEDFILYRSKLHKEN